MFSVKSPLKVYHNPAIGRKAPDSAEISGEINFWGWWAILDSDQ